MVWLLFVATLAFVPAATPVIGLFSALSVSAAVDIFIAGSAALMRWG